MKITIYDGANTIGGNKIHIEENDNCLFLDFGMNLAKYSKFKVNEAYLWKVYKKIKAEEKEDVGA